MKKLTAFILLIALVCSLCVFAPSAAALTEEEEALYTKYADLIALLEAEDFNAALETVTSMMPATEFEEITLTAENFFDYFEIATENRASNGTQTARSSRSIRAGLLSSSKKISSTVWTGRTAPSPSASQRRKTCTAPRSTGRRGKSPCPARAIPTSRRR